jgi:hypothetical protein
VLDFVHFEYLVDVASPTVDVAAHVCDDVHFLRWVESDETGDT